MTIDGIDGKNQSDSQTHTADQIKSDLTRVRHLQNSTRVQLNACRNPEDMIVRFAIQQLSTPATCIARNACTGVLYCAHGKSDDHVFRISAECLTLVRSLLSDACAKSIESTDSVPANCAMRNYATKNEVVVGAMPAARAWLVGRNAARGAHRWNWLPGSSATVWRKRAVL